MKSIFTSLSLRSILVICVTALFIAGPVHSETFTYDVEWYSGASQPWVYAAAPKLLIEVYEDLSTPENDVLFKISNNIDDPLGYKSSIADLQIDTGTMTPDIFSDVFIWDYSGEVIYTMYPPGDPWEIMDIVAIRIAMTADYAAGRYAMYRPKTEGVNPGEYVILKGVLNDGYEFTDVINSINVGLASNYVDGPYNEWTQTEKNTYRAESTKGLRFALHVLSIVPNEWNQDGQGLFVTNSLVSDGTSPQITSLTAEPSSILDNDTSLLTVVANDPDSAPDPLSYQWSVLAGGGFLDDPASPAPTYIPEDVTGTHTVTLRVDVSDGAATVSEELSLQVTDADPPPPGVELLSENFSNDSLSGWSVWDDGIYSAPSDWDVEAEELVQRSNNWGGSGREEILPKPGTYLLYDAGLGWLDYRASFMMRSEDNDALGIMFRYRDADNYYRFSWDSQRRYRRLVKNEGGVFTELAVEYVPYVQGQNYQVEIVAHASELEVWIDGKLIFQVTDSAHQQGSIAFYCWMLAGAYFDNLVVEDLSGGAGNSFPQINSLTAEPSSILDSETSLLTVVANDPDSGPDPLSYQWSVLDGGGSFDYPGSPTPMYMPEDVTGTQTVTLRVDVSDGAASVSEELSLQVTDADAPPLVELFSENFSSGFLNGWSIWDDGIYTFPSDWEVEAGELVQRRNIWGGSGRAEVLPKLGTYLLYDGGMGWLDYRASFVMRAEDNDALGIIFRYRDADNYYRFSWDSQRSYRRLVKNESGVFTELAVDHVPYVEGQNYQVEIVAYGTQLEVWVDGIRIFQVIDSTHQQGSLAFYSWMLAGAYFDDLVVEDLSGAAN